MIDEKTRQVMKAIADGERGCEEMPNVGATIDMEKFPPGTSLEDIAVCTGFANWLKAAGELGWSCKPSKEEGDNMP